MAIDIKKIFSDAKNSFLEHGKVDEKNVPTAENSTSSSDSLSSRIRRISATPPEAIQPEPRFDGAKQDDKNLVLSAKIIEPTAEQIIRFSDRISRRKIRRLAERTNLQARADEFEARVKLPEDTIDSAKMPLSRILARRVKSSEALDWLALSAVAIEIKTGYDDVAAELRLIAKQNSAMAKGEQK